MNKKIQVDIVRTKDVQVSEKDVKKGMLLSINPGDRVTILVPNSKRINRETGLIEQEWKESTGRAVMRGSLPLTWILNMGGRFGTPGIASMESIVKVRKRRA